MDGKRWYWCEPARNKACRKRSCCEYGGTCELTSSAEYAVRDPEGNPVEADPRQLLREKVQKSRKDRKKDEQVQDHSEQYRERQPGI